MLKGLEFMAQRMQECKYNNKQAVLGRTNRCVWNSVHWKTQVIKFECSVFMFGKAWEREQVEENMMEIMTIAAAVIKIAVLITIHTVEFTLFYTSKTTLLFTESVLL